MRNVKRLPVVMVSAALVLLGGCEEKDDDADGCTPLAATDFPCANPNECLSVTATWCFPGASTCATTDVDLSLELPGGAIIGVGNGEAMSANGCVLDGDEQADVFDPDDPGPFDENIACSPFVHPQPPDRIDAGGYVIEVEEPFSIFSTEDVLLDINVNGQTSCQIVNIDAGPARVEVVYP